MNDIWHVYMLRNERGALYTGITTDVQRRFKEHASRGPKAAKCLRGSRSLFLVYHCKAGSKRQAQQIEYRIKKLKKIKKEELVVLSPSLKGLARLLSMKK